MNYHVIQLMVAITHKELVTILLQLPVATKYLSIALRVYFTYTYVRIRGLIFIVVACPFTTHNGIPTNCPE